MSSSPAYCGRGCSGSYQPWIARNLILPPCLHVRNSFPEQICLSYRSFSSACFRLTFSARFPCEGCFYFYRTFSLCLPHQPEQGLEDSKHPFERFCSRLSCLRDLVHVRDLRSSGMFFYVFHTSPNVNVFHILTLKRRLRVGKLGKNPRVRPPARPYRPAGRPSGWPQSVLNSNF